MIVAVIVTIASPALAIYIDRLWPSEDTRQTTRDPYQRTQACPGRPFHSERRKKRNGSDRSGALGKLGA